MSRDDALCHAAQQAYRQSADAAIALVRYGQKHRDHMPPGRMSTGYTNFEAWPDPVVRAAFDQAGLHMLVPTEGQNAARRSRDRQPILDWPDQGLLQADVFNNGEKHWVELRDFGFHGGTYSTTIGLLRDGLTEADRLYADTDALLSGTDERLNSLMQQRQFGIYGRSSEGYSEVYLLRLWPNFRALMDKANRHEKVGKPIDSYFPGIPWSSAPITERIYQFKNDVYTIANQYDVVTRSRFDAGPVVIYRMDSGAPADVCYLSY